ncbi:hypothetical protein [Alkanindiges illinoisensis]|uniref:Uncharacterized protein n=1 Tax=Alkanindiges illinoisensis TaxID=197183 RepID=A0A4Y7XEY6_9GAMM|nr:hypothetical protein [Alkanindiges illinoisensis]TEU30176.1 hypothetical protein E2B99_03025 [Alkanindiges illinoisensis]
MLKNFSFILTIVLFFFTKAYASEIYDSSEKCDSFIIVISPINDTVKVLWKEKSIFPNPPKTFTAGDNYFKGLKQFTLNCPDRFISYDGNILKIKSDDYLEKTRNLLNGNIDISYSYYYDYPNIKEGYHSNKLIFDLHSYEIKNSPSVSSELSGKIIGTKIDDSELLPLIYDSKIYDHKTDMRTADVIEIFSKTEAIWEKIYIKKSDGVIELHKKFQFPDRK